MYAVIRMTAPKMMRYQANAANECRLTKRIRNFTASSALAATKLLLRYVSKHSFAAFAWYRIVFGGVILVTAWTGLVRW